MTAAATLATAADLLDLDPEGRWEILGGGIVEKAAPSADHGTAQLGTSGQLWGPFQRRPGGSGGPGGWWLMVEVEVELAAHDVVRPDLVGWRRDPVPQRPTGFPVRIRPDWVGEVLSPSTAARDLGEKRRLLHHHEVPWYWIIDPASQVVQVLRWTAEGYLIQATAQPGDHVGLPPFEAVAIDVGRIFGIEEENLSAEPPTSD